MKREKLILSHCIRLRIFPSLYRLVLITIFGFTALFGSAISLQAQQIMNQVAKLSADDAADNDQFGYSVAIDGNRALVGAKNDDNEKGDNVGAVYVFEFQNGNWTQTAKLVPPNNSSFVEFGFSVDLSNNYAVIGAPNAELGVFDTKTGVAYIFELQNDGAWIQTAALIGNDTKASHEFGCSVAIEDSLALIGACDDDQNGNASGSAYIFERQSDGSWTEQFKLVPDDGTGADYFAESVSLFNERVLIGARGDDDNGDASGSAYIFERQNDASWKQTAKLIASDGQRIDSFGYSVSLESDRALIGAIGHDSGLRYSGSAYVFERQNDGTWIETAKLRTTDDENMGLIFANAVALSGGVALVGAYDDNGVTPGSAYSFRRQTNGSWVETDRLLASDGVRGDLFGISVALSGNFYIVGASYDDDNGNNAGLAYIFDRTISTSFDLTHEIPSYLKLENNYPNPFNPTTTISYSLPESGYVTLSVYDLLGRQVTVLVNDKLQSAGRHNAIFEANGISSGIYLYRLQSGDDVRTAQMILLK